MGRKRRPEPDDKEQSARFVEIAGLIHDEKSEDRLNQALEKILNLVLCPRNS